MGSLGDSNFNGSGKLFAGTLETFGETSFFLTAGAAGFGFGRAGVFRADLGLKTGLVTQVFSMRRMLSKKEENQLRQFPVLMMMNYCFLF